MPRNVSNYGKPLPIPKVVPNYPRPTGTVPTNTQQIGPNGQTLQVPVGYNSQEGREFREAQPGGDTFNPANPARIVQPANTTQGKLDAIDAKYNAIVGFQDPEARAREKQAILDQEVSETNARLTAQAAAQAKQDASIQRAKAALTPGQQLQANAKARGTARKTGKIPVPGQPTPTAQPTDSLGYTSQPIAGGAISPTTGPTAGPGSPPAAGTAPAGPGGQSASTDTAEVPEDGIVNPDGTVTPAITPEAAGIQAAMMNLPPEAQFLAPFLQQYQATVNKSLSENAKLTKDLLDKNEQGYQDIHADLNTMAESYKATNEVMQGLLKEAKEGNEKVIQEQRNAEMARLQLEEDRQTRTIEKQKRKGHEANVAELALAGGFGQDAGIRAINEADAEFDTRLADLQMEATAQATALSAKFTGMYVENNNNYINESRKSLKETQAELQKIWFEDVGAKKSKQAAEKEIVTKAWETQTNMRVSLAEKNMGIAWQMQGLVKEAKQEKIDKEDRALKQITTLLKDFPENEVRDIVLNLGKDVTSFSVENMLNAKSKEEIKATQQAVFARQEASRIALMKKKMDAPLVTESEFMSKKIAEKEQALGYSMSSKMRDEYLKTNADYFTAEYGQYSSPSMKNLTSGDPNIDAATDAFMRGDFTTIKEASKTFGVNPSEVAIYAGELKAKGMEVGDIRALEKEQKTELTALRKGVATHESKRALDIMSLAIPKISTAAGSATGVGDVALINFYQNGVVDPGLAVRKEDMELIMAAGAIKDKLKPEFIASVVAKRAYLPPETRAEMERIATQVYAATQRIYEEKAYKPAVEQGEMSGIGSQYFKYLKPVQVDVEGAPADDFVSSFGY